ncbi:C40 family peptidase [Leifsonia sp. TF02-11]|uniref:C40 family peptidase n=1 Tax=Leifsonia sp. TF02-11 TaxID=2815212 RepID=UPI001AA1502B|nr:C40 family peptidase [Leifsonia sp. TF02-11]MBO1739257.1 C40 family peptidase [Leifsonia sp. TF02-11]
MASDSSKNPRIRPGLAIGAGVMGAVTASIGIVTPAQAVDYPSWNDVQQAKANVANQQAMVANITALIGNLQSTVDAARIASEKAAEAYFQAKVALDKATAKESDLEAQASSAADKAKTSQMRAGLLASHLAKAGGGGDVSTELLLKGGGSGASADKLLFQLGTMSKLTEQSKAVYDQATKDKNTAEALTAQAKVAKAERESLKADADKALAAAQSAQSAAQSALAEQQTKSTELVAQLATLKNTSTQVEAAYLQGEAVKAQQEAARKAQEDEARRQQQQQQQGGGSSGGGSSNGGSSSGGSSSGGSSGGGPVSPPNGNVVQNAIAYARLQLGKPYIFGGEGPTGYDCSGLTMKAYASAGLYIGSHSVNDQYYTARGRGQLVPYSQRQAGDLIFWGSGPGSFYHVGIYIGGGMMIAAPTEGDVVKTQSVWGSPWSQVARPSA